MNKTRQIGLGILLIGIVIHFTLAEDISYFITGIIIGTGIGLLITGKAKTNT